MKILLSLLLAMAALRGTQAGSDQGVVNGRVTNATGAEGFPEVSVLLVGPLTGAAASAATSNPLMIEEIAEGSGARAIRATTDNLGHVVFRNLPSGQYMLKVQKEGYLGAVPTVTGGLTSMATASVTVNSGAPADVRIPLLRAAVLSGRIRDAGGRPLPNATVVAYQAGYRDGRQTLVQASSRRTDDRGEYRFFGQAPGQYYIAVTTNTSGRPPGFGPVPVTTGTAGSCCRTFYPSATDVASAVPLKFAEGSEVSGIDIDMRTTATYRISGRVFNGVPNGSSAVPALFLVSNSDLWDTDNSFQPSLSIATDGTFELQGVPSGSYQLVSTVSIAGRTYPGRTRVDVASRDVEGVNVTVSPGTEVRMRVLVDGNVATGTPIRLQLRAKETYLAAGLGGNPITADATGIYVFQGIPQGTYSVIPTAIPANSYVADVRDGGKSVNDTGLIVGDRAMGPIDVLVNTGAQSIRGIVRNAEGKPVPSANVVLVPPSPRRENALLYRTVRTDAEGGFALNNIPPGEYKLFAWQSLPNTAYMNAAFMEKYESRGRVVNIGSNGNSFDLTVIPAEVP